MSISDKDITDLKRMLNENSNPDLSTFHCDYPHHFDAYVECFLCDIEVYKTKIVNSLNKIEAAIIILKEFDTVELYYEERELLNRAKESLIAAHVILI
jgi:hypothetical protein